ncbi:hypothetical protein CLU79DRAFT_748659 [Phycomyces nitens]|nr:hypothetical protein CLU79DRAFT_748659 [Phycomyces nitens]
MNDDDYMVWSAVKDTWYKQYASYGESSAKVIRHLFDPNEFFAKGSTTSSMPLYTGKDAITNETLILIPNIICGHLHQMLKSAVLRSGLPEPALPSFQPRKYTDLTQCTISTPQDYQNLVQKLKKLNKGLDRLRDAKKELELAHRLIGSRQHIFVSLDIEAYEEDHSILLEIGWSIYDGKTDMYLDQHYLVSTYRHLTNGKYVDDQKMRFQFGTSVWCTLKQALEELRKDLDWAVERDGGFVLVGHGLESDIKYLAMQKFKWPGHREDVDNVRQSAAVAILNTDTMYGASIDNVNNPPSLGATLGKLGIDTWCLHNAGNDAHYTLVLFMSLIDSTRDIFTKSR